MRKFGLIGYPLTHSFSQRYFSEKFEREGIADCVYSNFSIGSIDDLGVVLADAELCGLNVTIPYKQQVMPFLDSVSPVVEAIGACNCIRIEGGRLAGHNTDVVGFEQSLVKKLSGHHRKALVLGTGGAAKAVEWVLRRLGIEFLSVSRAAGSGAIGYADVDAALLGTHELIVNTTPLGTYPDVSVCPPLPYEALTPQHYLFDLVYNPARTLFLQKGEAHGAVVENGYEMLVLQAEESWRIWTGAEGPTLAL
jgi:shikimate dehydrogenase